MSAQIEKAKRIVRENIDVIDLPTPSPGDILQQVHRRIDGMIIQKVDKVMFLSEKTVTDVTPFLPEGVPLLFDLDDPSYDALMNHIRESGVAYFTNDMLSMWSGKNGFSERDSYAMSVKCLAAACTLLVVVRTDGENERLDEYIQYANMINIQTETFIVP